MVGLGRTKLSYPYRYHPDFARIFTKTRKLGKDHRKDKENWSGKASRKTKFKLEQLTDV